MGRELKRVPLGFDWALNKPWWGYIYKYISNLPTIECGACDGEGRSSYPMRDWSKPDENGTYYCQFCSLGDAYIPKIEPPEGEGYQIWETVSEGSPISPVFATPEELARHMETTRWGADRGTSYESWLKFIHGPGWAPSMVMTDGVIQNGVEAELSTE